MTALGVLCCFALFVCLTLLASFFLPSHLSFKNMYVEQCKSDSVGCDGEPSGHGDSGQNLHEDWQLRTAGQSIEDKAAHFSWEK